MLWSLCLIAWHCVLSLNSVFDVVGGGCEQDIDATVGMINNHMYFILFSPLLDQSALLLSFTIADSMISRVLILDAQ